MSHVLPVTSEDGSNISYEVSGPRLLGEMSWPQVARALLATRTVVLACGSIEQHGPHLPLLSDWFQGEDLIRRIVAALGEQGHVVVGGFGIPFAPAEDALPFPGTLSLSNGTYIALLGELLEGLEAHGFTRFPLIVCHEQAMGPAMSAVREFNSLHPDASAAVLTGWYHAGVATVRDQLCTGPHPERDGHAGELETSRMLLARPELVNLELAGTHYPPAPAQLPFAGHPLTGGGLYKPPHDARSLAPDGFVGAAQEATAAKGERSGDLALQWLCDVIKRDLL